MTDDSVDVRGSTHIIKHNIYPTTYNYVRNNTFEYKTWQTVNVLHNKKTDQK